MTATMSAYRAERAEQSANGTKAPPRQPVLVALARFVARHLPAWSAVRTIVLTIAGFACLTAAAWLIHMVAGLAAAGVSLLVLEMLSRDGTDR